MANFKHKDKPFGFIEVEKELKKIKKLLVVITILLGVITYFLVEAARAIQTTEDAKGVTSVS